MQRKLLDSYGNNLGLPERRQKSRTVGLTHVVDHGIHAKELELILESSGKYIDFWEFSPESLLAYHDLPTPNTLFEKVRLCRRYDVKTMLSGFMFEKFVQKDNLDAYIKFCMESDVKNFVVSNSMATKAISDVQKLDYIQQLAKLGTVYSRVGTLDRANVIPPYKWIELMKKDLEAGAEYVFAGGLATNSGIYRGSGEVREGLVQEILTQIDVKKIIWDATLGSQQTYFLELIGNDANISNVATNKILELESMRLGLNHRTFDLFNQE